MSWPTLWCLRAHSCLGKPLHNPVSHTHNDWSVPTWVECICLQFPACALASHQTAGPACALRPQASPRPLCTSNSSTALINFSPAFLLAMRLETHHSIIPGIPVPLSCPHARATESISKIPGLLPHSFKSLDACLIQIAGHAPHSGLPPHSPSPSRESSRGSWPPLTPCVPSLLWRSENPRPSATRRPQGHFLPLPEGLASSSLCPSWAKTEIQHPGTDPRRSAFGLCPGSH